MPITRNSRCDKCKRFFLTQADDYICPACTDEARDSELKAFFIILALGIVIGLIVLSILNFNRAVFEITQVSIRTNYEQRYLVRETQSGGVLLAPCTEVTTTIENKKGQSLPYKSVVIDKDYYRMYGNLMSKKETVEYEKAQNYLREYWKTN